MNRCHYLFYISLVFIIFVGISTKSFAQIVYPDNVVETECFGNITSWEWGIQKGDSSIVSIAPFWMPLVGDIDGDGRNEVIILRNTDPQLNHGLVILNDELELKHEITFPPSRLYSVLPLAIADVDQDGIAEIFLFHRDSTTLECYNYDGVSSTLKWSINPDININPTVSSGKITIADINGDGIPELHIYTKIFNSQTGTLLLDIPETPSSTNPPPIYSSPAFIDFDGDGILELARSDKVHKIQLTNPNGTAGNSSTLWKSTPIPNPTRQLPAVADIDLDGYLDIIYTKGASVYAWNPYSGVGSTPFLVGECVHTIAVPYDISSIPLIADFNNDGYPEIAWSAECLTYAVKYNTTSQNLEPLWVRDDIVEYSGTTGMTAFDFDQDGFLEIVYRDHNCLRIIEGATGNDLSLIYSNINTNTDYPVIVDLDRDGEAEILITERKCSYPNGVLSCYYRVAAYRSSTSSRWAPTRYVWNQYGYNVINVNNDLTIPQQQFNPATIMTGSNGEIRRPFNNYLQQASILNQYGEPFVPLPDLVFLPTEVPELTDISCDSLLVRFCFTNEGSVAMDSPFPCSFYQDDINGRHIHTYQINTTIEVGETHCEEIYLSFRDIPHFFPLDQLFIALNDTGDGVNNNTTQQDCKSENNYATAAVHFEFSTIITADICTGDAYTDYGFDIQSEDMPSAGLYTFDRRFSVSEICDSIYWLFLTVHDNYSETREVKGCETYTYDGVTYSESGSYTLNYISIHGCDSIVILDLTILDVNAEITNETSDLCKESSAVLSVEPSPGANYRWNTHEVTPSIVITEGGTYSVTVSNEDCRATSSITIEKCELYFYLPSAISPSKSDGVNDFFSISWSNPFSNLEFEIAIYDRWGTLVFYSKDPNFKWDGSCNGEIASNVVYNYVIWYKPDGIARKMRKGTVVVM